MRIIISMLIVAFTSMTLWAAPSNTPTIMVQMANDGCPESVREIGNGGAGSPVARCVLNGIRQSDAVCKTAGSSIAWKLVGNRTGLADPPFSIQFKDTSTQLMDSCAWNTTGPKSLLSCTIKSLPTPAGPEYPYNFTVNYTTATDTCLLDPRIIITNNLLRETPEQNNPAPEQSAVSPDQ